MTLQELFKMTMALIDEMLETGNLDAEAVAEYRAKTPSIVTMLQAELTGIKNRYKGPGEQIQPQIITDMNSSLIVDNVEAFTILSNGLASHLLIHENTSLAGFFQQRYEELKGLFMKPIPQEAELIEDVYSSLEY